jgi:hypothetical protein
MRDRAAARIGDPAAPVAVRGGQRLPAFSSPEDIAHWPADIRRDAAVVLAARVALRVIPQSQARTLNLDRLTLLRTFRCAQAAWAVAAYPGQAALLRPAAAAAAWRIYGPDETKVESAEWASAAAGVATDEDALRFASLAVTYAIADADDAARPVRQDILKSCAADAYELERGSSPVTLALSSNLWPGQPNWARDNWKELKAALLSANEDWEVWTDWYEARLNVGGEDQALEVARATIPDRTWEQGPKVVNGQIRQMFEERGIWRHGDMADAPAAGSLATFSLQELAVIGARVALRAVPLMSFGSVAEPTFSAALLSMLRVTSLAWAASAYPTKAPNRVVLNAARIDAINTRVGLVRAAAAATATSCWCS